MRAAAHLRVLLFLGGITALAQTPAVNPGGIVNAASFAAVSANGVPLPLAPGSIASLFGIHLASETHGADVLPLPTTLGGTTVTVNGIEAPLFYVSPLQINFQVPASAQAVIPNIGTPGTVSVVVTTAAGRSQPAVATIFYGSPGVFTQNGAGSGAGAIANVKPDGTTSLNTTANSASPGDYIAIFATGLGLARPQPADGEPAPSQPLAVIQSDGFGAGVPFYADIYPLDGLPDGPVVEASSSFTGKAPGFVGLDQVNVRIPSDAPEGCAVPLQVAIGPQGVLPPLSQPVTISIHSGNGQCVDPPIGSAGQLVLKKTVVLNDQAIPEVDILIGSFSASPGKVPLPSPAVIPSGFETLTGVQESPAVSIPGYTTLNAGSILISGPEGQIEIQSSELNGTTAYQAILPAGFVQPGNFQLAAAGEAIGPFQTALTVGSGIQVTSQFPKGTEIDGYQTITVNWTGGQTGEVATLSVVEHQFYYDFTVAAQFPAEGGTAYIYPTYNTGSAYPVVPVIQDSSNIEIVLTVGPDPSQPQTISAPGLTLGGQAGWQYEYRFTGLRFGIHP